MEMGEKIYNLRTKKGLTLEELGNMVGVGKSTVRKWEKGMIANMKRDKIAKLATALNTTPAYLMGWETEDTIVAKETDETTLSIPEIIEHYNKLNATGKKEATKRVQELTYFPHYIQSDISTSELSVNDIPDTFEEMEKKVVKESIRSDVG